MNTQRIKLISDPTPLEALPRLGKHLGIAQLYVKRDDEGGRGGGGNKLRKYEVQMFDAIDKGADTIILAAHPQSNAAREIVATAAQLGLHCTVAVKEMIPANKHSMRSNGNRFLMSIMGADLVHVPMEQDFDEAMTDIVKSAEEKGRRCYVLPFGASNGLGVVGYMHCANELIEQCNTQFGKAPDHVFVACGSGGTLAGLAAGFSASNCHTKVHGVSILKPVSEAQEMVNTLVTQGLKEASRALPSKIDIDILPDPSGTQYGEVADCTLEMIKTCARLEGLLLDPVYTGKAMLGLSKFATHKPFRDDELVIFVHTGGLPLLFGYADYF